MWTIENFKEIYVRYQSSGLPIADFCSNERITRSRFYYWLKQYRKLPKEDIIIKRVRSTEAGGKPGAGFIPVLLAPGLDDKENPLKALSNVTRPSTLAAGSEGDVHPFKAPRKKERHIKPSASGSFMEICYQNGTTVRLRGEKDMELIKTLILISR